MYKYSDFLPSARALRLFCWLQKPANRWLPPSTLFSFQGYNSFLQGCCLGFNLNIMNPHWIFITGPLMLFWCCKKTKTMCNPYLCSCLTLRILPSLCSSGRTRKSTECLEASIAWDITLLCFFLHLHLDLTLP